MLAIEDCLYRIEMESVRFSLVGFISFQKYPKKLLLVCNLKIQQCATATFLVNAGGDVLDLQELGGWESSKVARGYLEENLTKKVSIAQKIQSSDILESSASCSRTKKNFEGLESLNIMSAESFRKNVVVSTAAEELPITVDTKNGSIKFENCQNIVINFHK